MSKDYLNYVLDTLSVCGAVTARAMFGGYGIYKDGVIFAIIAEDELYFKVDGSNINQYKELGSEPFVFQSKGKSTTMSYWKLPLEIMEEESLLVDWVNQSCLASIRGKKK
ncbi:MAG: hypothetical protein Tsb006_2730 [Rickettsiaceae bacterium]